MLSASMWFKRAATAALMGALLSAPLAEAATTATSATATATMAPSSSTQSLVPASSGAPERQAHVSTRAPWLAAVFWYDVDPATWSADRIARILRDAAQGSPDGQYDMAVLLEEGTRMPQDLPEALRRYRAAAEQGHANAQASVARMLLNGWGTTKDMAEARIWNARAAEQGQRRAIFNEAYLRRSAPGTVRDRAIDMTYFVQAGKAGLPQGALEAARGLRRAPSPQDRAQAWTWLSVATEANFPPALMAFDQWCNEDPDGPGCVPRAGQALLAAATAGYPPAQRWLGLRLWDSNQPPTHWAYLLWKPLHDLDPDNPVLDDNRPEGARWLTRAAQLGDALSLYNVGILLEEQNERAKYYEPAYRVLPIEAIRSCYFHAAMIDPIPEAMMALVIAYRNVGEDDGITDRERDALTNYWVGKIAETGAFEARPMWAVTYSDWREQQGKPAPAFLRKGVSGQSACRLDPLPGAPLNTR